MAGPYTTDRNYSIVLSDAALVASLQAQFPTGILVPPATAAITYGAPIAGAGEGGPLPAPPRIDLYGHSGSSILATNVESATYPAGQTINGDGILFPCTPSVGGTIQWRGSFILEAAGVSAPLTEALQTRRWICGFEIPTGGEGVGDNTSNSARDASRTPNGFGFAYRSTINSGRTYQFGAGSVTAAQPASSWERFYVRLRTLPTADEDIWSTTSTVSSGQGLHLSVSVTGALKLFNIGAGGLPGVLVGTSAQCSRLVWTRVDILFQYATASIPTGRARLFLNGVLQFDVVVASGQGLDAQNLHASSSVGNVRSATTSGLEADIDDWINCSVPTLFTGNDWLNGSHIQLVLPTVYGATNSANWVGDVRTLAANPASTLILDSVVGSTGGSILNVQTDYIDRQLGCAAFWVSWLNISSAGVTSQLGWKINGTQTVASITVTNDAWNSVLYQAGGNVLPPALAPLDVNQNLVPLEFVYIKDAGGGTQDVNALQGAAEYLGVWGPEDQPPTQAPVVFSPRAQMHNAPYWLDPPSNAQQPPIASVAVIGGTYVGNGTGQDIDVKVPIHWWASRSVSSAIAGVTWWSSLLAGHVPGSSGAIPNRFVRAFRATDGTYKVSIFGAGASYNQNGVTYQWVGFSDPGMRYLLNGANSHLAALATFSNQLADSQFTPLAAFLILENLGNTSTTSKEYYKGPGHTTNRASLLNAADSASIATFGAGTLTTLTAAHDPAPQTAYSAWRVNDGVAAGPLAITSYTGDGTGARTITLALGGLSPLYAMVVPHDAAAFYRDPSHATTHSSQVVSGADSTTAITGGDANLITIAATLNTNATIYDVFVLGGTVQSGWSPATSTTPTPIFATDTIPRALIGTGAWSPNDTHGWWWSTIKFAGAANLAVAPSNPKDARDWQKLAAFATGNAGSLGGAPGAGVVVDNQLIYAGNDYALGTGAPTIRVFDGISDRLMTSIPPTSAGVIPIAIVAMLQVGEVVYVSTLDSGTSAANWAGRVFSFDPLSQNLTPLPFTFETGEVPYALAWHLGRLWVGTNNGNGTSGNIYFLRPNIDTLATLDYDLGTSSAGGACSLCSYHGTLYIGTDNAAASPGLVLARDSLGAYTTSLTSASTAVNNGFYSMIVFNDRLYAGYWNPATVALVQQFDGTTWATVFTGATVNIRPFIGMMIRDNYLLVIGGGSALSAALVATANGTAWDNLTPFLTGPTTETALPIFGGVGA